MARQRLVQVAETFAVLGRDRDRLAQPQPVRFGQPLLAGDRLLIAGTLGDLLSLSPYTGELIGKLEVRDPVRLGPVVANRTIYVLTDSGRLIALR